MKACVLPYIHPYPFEIAVLPKMTEVVMAMHNNRQWSAMLSAAYVLVIFSLKHWMKHRQRWDLRRPLILWNVALAVFSIGGTIRSWQLMLSCVSTQGWSKGSLFSYISANGNYEDSSVYQFWAQIFMFSKIVELGDTLFIVLRKSPLIFLHWYHHVTVLCYVWCTLESNQSPGKIFLMNNFTVHAFMYTYYAVTAYGYRVPNWIKQGITMLQLSQMVVGVSITLICIYCKLNDIPFRMSNTILLTGILMYASYFVLFAKFYYDAYLSPRIVSSKNVSRKIIKNGQPQHTDQSAGTGRSEAYVVNDRARESIVKSPAEFKKQN